jgi:hypothetical protein
MWNWFLTALLCLPVSILLPLSQKNPTANQKKTCPNNSGADFKVGFLIAAVLTILIFVISIRIHDYRPLATALFRGDVGQITDLATSMGLSPIVWNIVLTTFAALLGAMMTWNNLRLFSGRPASNTAGMAVAVALPALVAPPSLIPVALITSIGIAALRKITDKPAYGIWLAAAVSAGQAIFFIFY